MVKHFTVLVGCVAFAASGGCAGHNVKYTPYIHCKIPPNEHATAVSGNIEEARPFFERATLPHNGPREKYQVMLDGLGKLTDQLGSPDYVVIGEVFGGGNAWANQATLTEAFCRKAARQGGDVVMIFRRDTFVQPYQYTVPGQSTTNASATAYGNANYATAYGTSHTTYTPSQTYSGVFHKPIANGLVFKHVPGVDAERRAMSKLEDGVLGKAIQELEELGRNKKITWAEARARVKQLVAADDGS